MRAYLAIALLIALIGSHWAAYSAGVSRERDRNVAASSARKDVTAAKVDRDTPAVCVATRPDSVRKELDAAYRATADSIRAMRREATDSPANGP